jgi:quercetin dioxygenase-like cupin family protein
VGAVEQTVRVIPLDGVEQIPLPRDSWSAMVLDSNTLAGNTASLGYSVFKPGCATAMVRHETEEVAFVLAGHGELALDEESVPFAAGQGLFVPAGTWHAVVNTGDEDVVMVFGFPSPAYPPTARREPAP